MLLARSPAAASALSALFREKSRAAVQGPGLGHTARGRGRGSGGGGGGRRSGELRGREASSAAGIRRTYLAVVVGVPREKRGVVSVPLLQVSAGAGSTGRRRDTE